MKANKKSAKRKPQRFSFILIIGIILAIGYFAISSINIYMQKSERAKELEELNVRLEEQVDENDRLQKVIDGDDKDEYIEHVAREKLGYVMPGERVYYNITPNN